MDGSAAAWRTLFENWPGSVPRAGQVIAFGESIPFKDFLIGEGVLLLDRERPDSSGARKVIVSFDAISGLKTSDTLELSRYQAFGFAPPA